MHSCSKTSAAAALSGETGAPCLWWWWWWPELYIVSTVIPGGATEEKRERGRRVCVLQCGQLNPGPTYTLRAPSCMHNHIKKIMTCLKALIVRFPATAEMLLLLRNTASSLPQQTHTLTTHSQQHTQYAQSR